MKDFQVEVIRNRPAPSVAGSHKSKWQDFFDGMYTGNWFLVAKTDRDRLNSAAYSRIPGRYRIYRSDEYPGVHVFVMVAI